MSEVSWAWIVWTNISPRKIMNRICPDINALDPELCPNCRHKKCAKDKECMKERPRCDSDMYHYAGLSYNKAVSLECDMERVRSSQSNAKERKAYMDYRAKAQDRVAERLRKAYKRCLRYQMELRRVVK